MSTRLPVLDLLGRYSCMCGLWNAIIILLVGAVLADSCCMGRS